MKKIILKNLLKVLLMMNIQVNILLLVIQGGQSGERKVKVFGTLGKRVNEARQSLNPYD